MIVYLLQTNSVNGRWNNGENDISKMFITSRNLAAEVREGKSREEIKEVSRYILDERSLSQWKCSLESIHGSRFLLAPFIRLPISWRLPRNSLFFSSFLFLFFVIRNLADSRPPTKIPPLISKCLFDAYLGTTWRHGGAHVNS